jgi:hypothetical protein
MIMQQGKDEEESKQEHTWEKSFSAGDNRLLLLC